MCAWVCVILLPFPPSPVAIYFLSVLEARSLRSRRQQVRFLPQPLPLACRWLPLAMSSCGHPSNCDFSASEFPLPTGTPVLEDWGSAVGPHFSLITSVKGTCPQAVTLGIPHRPLPWRFRGAFSGEMPCLVLLPGAECMETGPPGHTQACHWEVTVQIGSRGRGRGTGQYEKSVGRFLNFTWRLVKSFI